MPPLGRWGDHEFRLDVFLGQAWIVAAADQREQRPFYGRGCVPTQARGPAPKEGMHRVSGRSPSNHRSGMNRSGSGQKAGCRCRLFTSDGMIASAGKGDAADRDGARVLR